MDAEQAIEEMTQEGYLIYRVTVFQPLVDCCSTGQWIPLEKLDDISGSAIVWLWGKQVDENCKNYIVECKDMQWLADWWEGRWQANI